jgi:hypothetical protein
MEHPATKRFKSNNLRKTISQFLFAGIYDTKVKNDVVKFRALWDGLGFRTTIVESPRAAVSIYLDSCECSHTDRASLRAFFSTMIGMNPIQADLERFYGENVKDPWCLLLFCKRIENACCDGAIKDSFTANVLIQTLEETIRLCKSFVNGDVQVVSFDQRERTMEIRRMATTTDDRVRLDQLDRELDRIHAHNSTLSNAMARILFDFHETVVKDVELKKSHLPQYQRLSFYLYDPEIDELKPPTFLFMPCLYMILKKGYRDIVNHMVDTFWKEMLKRGYFASSSARSAIDPNLKRYIESGMTNNPNVPLVV